MTGTYYNIADIVIKIECPFFLEFYGGEDFLCEPAEPDYYFRFEQTESFQKMLNGAVKVARLEWADDYRLETGELVRAFRWQEEVYAALTVCKEKEGVCYYIGREFLQVLNQRRMVDLSMYLCIERILMLQDSLLLHSSHIEVEGQGLVFSAPSQTGKSTQAELWRTYARATVKNGDRSVLRIIDGNWNVCGCPMCGSSGIHLQGWEPLKHIVMLEQGKDNKVRRISVREAVRLLYPQITVTNWDQMYLERVSDLLGDLISKVPIWQFSCTKDPEAVRVLKEALEFPGGKDE